MATEAVATLRRDGAVILRGVVDPEAVAAARADLDRLFARRRGDGRIQDGWRSAASLRGLARLPVVLTTLAEAFARRPVPFQTLSFRVGTEQPLHADAVHFASVPPRLVAAAWVALEQVGPDDGPLAYVPGSHLWPEVDGLLDRAQPEGLDGLPDHTRYEAEVAALVATRSEEPPVAVLVDPGDVVLWTSHVLHGGQVVARPGATRRSHVTHYTFDGCTLLTPLLSRPGAGEHHVRVVHDLDRRRHVPPRVDGRRVAVHPTGGGRARLVIAPGWRATVSAGAAGVRYGLPRSRARMLAAAARAAARARPR